jgi:hypothetical protein
MQFLTQHDQKHVVCNVELVVLHFVVRAPVVILAFAVLVVATTIFEATPVDGRCDGSSVTGGIVVAESRICIVL